MAGCNFTLDADRPDGHYPNYQVSDVAILRIKTDPQQPNRKLCRKRWFRKPGDHSYKYQGETDLRSTDSNGVSVQSTYIPNKPSIFGDYIDRYYICDCPAQYDLSIYSVTSKELMETKLAELSDQVEEPIEELKSVV